MTASILTKREVLQQTSLEENTLNQWIESNILEPIRVYEGNVVFLHRHVQLISQIKALLEAGHSVEQIQNAISNSNPNEDFNLDELIVNVGIHQAVENFEEMSYNELIERARSAGISNFRRMNRRQLISCLTNPEERLQIEEEVRELVRTRYNNTPTESQEVTPQENTEIVMSAEEQRLRELSYTEIVEEAKGVLTGFRRMTKEELIIALAYPERREDIVNDVRERTRQRYGGHGSTPNTSTRTRTSRSMQLEQVQEEININTLEVVNDDLILEEDVTTYDNETIEEVNESVVVDLTPEQIEQLGLTEPVSQVHFDMSEDELRSMGIKRLQEFVRDNIQGVKYFRRMEKEELINVILDPDTRSQMMLNAWQRYQYYNNRQRNRG